MTTINSLLGGFFGLLMAPFRSMNAWVGLIWVSLIITIPVMFILKYTANSAGIKKARDRFSGHLLEMWLYRNEVGPLLASLSKVYAFLGVYIGHFLIPMAVMIVPFIFVGYHMDAFFGFRPLENGESAVVTARLSRPVPLRDLNLSLIAPETVKVETPALRIQAEGDSEPQLDASAVPVDRVEWRIRAGEGEGVYPLRLESGKDVVEKSINIGSKVEPVSLARVSSGLVSRIENPVESALPGNLPLAAIEVNYPEREMTLLGKAIPWWVSSLALIVIFAFAMKGVFKIEL